MAHVTTLSVAQQIAVIEQLLEQDKKYRAYAKQLPNELYCTLTELPIAEANEMKIDIALRALFCQELLEEYYWIAYEFPFRKNASAAICRGDVMYEIWNEKDFLEYLRGVYLNEENL